ncbi:MULTISPECIES: ketopantoate reductase family protein [unclassified Pseudarthrobacter]|uniref:ketopantoate reductase family protein n=1 Tax=unclassified Pseudarthrobacter TaxID=2647000 RepID=UPI0036325BBE
MTSHRHTKRGYTIIGAGAIGGTVGHALLKAGHPVVFIDTDASHVQAVRDEGLGIRFPDGREDTVQVPHIYTPDDYPAGRGPIERAVIATKSQHTLDAAQWAAAHLSHNGFIVSLQNGHNEPVIASVAGPHRVLGAFVNIFADYLEPGVISFGGPGALSVGHPGGGAPDTRVLDVASDFRAYGPVTSTANLAGYRWAKRSFAAILGLASVVDAPLADVVAKYPDLAFLAAREAVEVAVREGIILESFDAFEPYAFSDAASGSARDAATTRLSDWLATQPKDRSGGFRDIAVRHRPTERLLIDDGYADLAAKHSVSTELNAAVRSILQDVAAGRGQFSWTHLDSLRRRFAEAPALTS